MNEEITYFGVVSILGRPNVGKSTLLNQLLGKKVSITSRKPHTTLQCITGIYTKGPYQIVYIDTPGLHIPEEWKRINRLMYRDINSSLDNVQLILFVVEGINWTLYDKLIIKKIKNISCPCILVINKIDSISDKRKLLPHLCFLSKQMFFKNIIPICAKNGKNVDTLSDIVHKALPQAKHHFPEDYITDCSQRFIASEIIREKLIRFLGDELPYSTKVKIERFVFNIKGNYHICALILVRRESHRKIILGKKGSRIKTIGIKARKDMETIFDSQVHLKLWIKIKSRQAYDR